MESFICVCTLPYVMYIYEQYMSLQRQESYIVIGSHYDLCFCFIISALFTTGHTHTYKWNTNTACDSVLTSISSALGICFCPCIVTPDPIFNIQSLSTEHLVLCF